MKKRLILLFALILLSSLVIADEVTLIKPIGDISNTNDMSFTCNVTVLSNLASIELFLGDDVEFKVNKSIQVTGSSADETFDVTGIEDGTWIWNCRANLENTSRIFAANNESFGISIAVNNIAPEQIQNLTNIEIEKNENLTLNMSEYFTDADGDVLTYSVSDETNIVIEVNDEIIMFTPAQGWSGEKLIDITADDGTENLTISGIKLKVVDPDAIVWENLTNSFKITSISPIETPYDMTTAETVVFSVTTNDATATYQWQLDGNDLPGATSSSYSMSSTATGTGTLSVIVTYSDQSTETQNWTLNIIEEAVIENVIEEEPVEPVCGNNVREVGEDCENCPADVACGPGFECQEKACVKSQEGFVGVLIGLVVGILVLIVGAIFVFRFIKRSTAPDKDDKIKPLSEVEKPKEFKTQERPIPDKPTEIKEIKPVKVNPKIEVEQKQVVDVKPDPLLMDFIGKMRAKGKNDVEIKAKLKASGWTDEQIAPGFK